jgi:type III secretory pathway component EscS
MKWLVKLILVSSLMSCSAQWHLKKAVRKDPMILQKDTLVVVDTVVSPPVAITDTVTLRQHDTIELVKDRLKVQLVKVNDTITIDAICDSDTIISVVEVPYEKITYIEKESPMQVVQRWLLYMVFIFLGYKGVLKLLGHR